VRPPRIRLLAASALALALSLGNLSQRAHAAQPRAGLTTVTVIMDWPVPWLGWSPWLVADALGYFKQEGIALKIVPPATVADPAKILGTGRADLGFTTILDVIEGKAQGIPITGIGAYAQYNNWGVISWKSDHLTAKDLKGKTIGVYPDAWSKTQLTIMLHHLGIAINQVKLIYTSDDTVPLLLAHKVDVITGTTNAEQAEAEVNGKRSTSIFLSNQYGVPNAYIQVFAANDSFAKAHPTLVKAWLRATRKGLTYALAHPTDVVNIFMKRFPSAATRPYATSSWAKTAPLFGSTFTKAHGYFWQTSDVWQSTQQVLLQYKIIDQTVPVSTLYTNSYL